MEIQTEKIEIPVAGGGPMGGYLARPADGERHPAVLVFMEIFGVNSHIRDVTERIAREGYVALAPDYFHRTGPGVELAYDDDGMAEGMKLLGGLDAGEMVSDAEAALGFLRSMTWGLDDPSMNVAWHEPVLVEAVVEALVQRGGGAVAQGAAL